jgi:hypothetical protein
MRRIRTQADALEAANDSSPGAEPSRRFAVYR